MAFKLQNYKFTSAIEQPVIRLLLALICTLPAIGASTLPAIGASTLPAIGASTLPAVGASDWQFAYPEFPPEVSNLSVTFAKENSLLQPSFTSSANEIINLATFNLWNFDNGLNWTTRLPFISSIVANDLGGDIVGFNEVRRRKNHIGQDGQDMFHDLSKALSPYGYKYGVYQVGMDYKDEHTVEGVALFTKYEIDSEGIQAIHLHMRQDEQQDHNKRVCLYVPIVLEPNTIFHAFVTHFSYSTTEQLDNARGVVAFMQHVLGNQKTSTAKGLALMGDFNTLSGIKDRELPMDLIKQSGMVDVWEQHATSDEEGNTYCNCKQSKEDIEECVLDSRIDRIFVQSSEGHRVKRVTLGPHGYLGDQQVCPSDHRAIGASISYKQQLDVE